MKSFWSIMNNDAFKMLMCDFEFSGFQFYASHRINWTMCSCYPFTTRVSEKLCGLMECAYCSNLNGRGFEPHSMRILPRTLPRTQKLSQLHNTPYYTRCGDILISLCIHPRLAISQSEIMIFNFLCKIMFKGTIKIQLHLSYSVLRGLSYTWYVHSARCSDGDVSTFVFYIKSA